ncbi:MAG: DUF1963 domain-containing protein [Planctomycetota bacterium]
MTLAPYLRTESGVHPTIDVDALRATYPATKDDIWHIGSPSDLLPWLRLRERFDLEYGAAVPCDLIFWGRGSGPNPRMTRIGGTPWLPKGAAWPHLDGVPLGFLCQFNFEDSRDLVGDLPGDVLLVFVVDPETLGWFEAGGGVTVEGSCG